MLSKLIYNKNYDKNYNIPKYNEFRIQKTPFSIQTTRYNYGSNYNYYYPENQYNVYKPYYLQGVRGKRGPRGPRGLRGENVDPSKIILLENKIEYIYSTFFNQHSDIIISR
jgi:hypothetical protein